MLNLERRKLLLSLVEEKGSVSVAELSQALSVSAVTVRKLLRELDQQGLIHRARGGAFSRSFPILEQAEWTKEQENIPQKKAIAAAAYQMIHPGDAIFVDAGSTTLQLSRLIRDGHIRNLTIITNGFNIAAELMEAADLDLYFLGGKVRHEIMSCVGTIPYTPSAPLYPRLSFLGTNAFSLERGATTPDPAEAQVKINMREAADRAILLSDSSKYGKCTMTGIGELGDYHCIICDKDLPKSVQEKIRQAGIKLLIVDY